MECAGHADHTGNTGHGEGRARVAPGLSEAVRIFPRGLAQPEGTFRFSADALLLGSYAAAQLPAGTNPLLADLGCGCGVCGLGTLLALKGEGGRLARCLGLELLPVFLEAAHGNAERLGFAGSYVACQMDFTQVQSKVDLENALGRSLPGKEASLLGDAGVGNFHLVMANPPYRLPGSGRIPRACARRLALFGDQGLLEAFVRVAAFALRQGGVFCCIFPVARQKELLDVLARHALAPYDMVLVRSRLETNVELSLMAARKSDKADQDRTVPAVRELLLHQEGAEGYTQDALNFCPYLSKEKLM